jgi:hypothetical protein
MSSVTIEKWVSRHCGGARHGPNQRRDYPQLKSQSCRKAGHSQKFCRHWPKEENGNKSIGYSGQTDLRMEQCGTSVTRLWDEKLWHNNKIHHAMQRTKGITTRNGVLCVSAPKVTSCNNRETVGGRVFCPAHPEVISRGPAEQASQSRV